MFSQVILSYMTNIEAGTSKVNKIYSLASNVFFGKFPGANGLIMYIF